LLRAPEQRLPGAFAVNGQRGLRGDEREHLLLLLSVSLVVVIVLDGHHAQGPPANHQRHSEPDGRHGQRKAEEQHPGQVAALFAADVLGQGAGLAGGLVDEPVVVDGVGDEIDQIEESVAAHAPRDLRARLAALRRKAIGLRRYLAPQRDVLSRLYVESSDLFDDRARLGLRECADSMLRYVEELDAARERAAVISEELTAAAGERMNRTMYVLSLVSTVFLPLGFVTGLLGVNIAGIPGTEVPFAFQLLTASLVVLAVVEVILFRRWRLL